MVQNKAPRQAVGSADLHIPVLQAVLADAIVDAAEVETLFGEGRRPRIRLL